MVFCSFKTKDKEALVDAYKILFDKVAIDKIGIFFNFTGFLLSELYDPVNHKGKRSLVEYDPHSVYFAYSYNNFRGI